MDTQPLPRRIGHAALRKGRVSMPGQIYHVTATTVERTPVCEDFFIACTASRSFETPALLGDARLLAWVLMPDHAHWLLQLGESHSLATVVNRLKSASTRNVNRASGRQGALWTRAFHDHAIRSDEKADQVARYIIVNPVRAGLVQCVGDYPFWNTTFL